MFENLKASPRPSLRLVKRYAKISLVYYGLYLVAMGFVLSGLKAGTLSGLMLYCAMLTSALPVIGWMFYLSRKFSALDELELLAMKNAGLVGLVTMMIAILVWGFPATLFPEKIVPLESMALLLCFIIGVLVGIPYWHFKLGLWGKASKDTDA